MREFLDDIAENRPLDPTEAARQAMRPRLRRRFYEAVNVVPQGPVFAIELDRRPVRTPGRRLLAAPSAALGAALAAEWEAQQEVIDPAQMPLTRLANSIIDGVADAVGAVRAEVVRFLGSDLVCYRAGVPEGLVARQGQQWDPILAWVHEALGARFVLVEGVSFAEQPAEAVAAAAAAVPNDPWRLGAIHSVTTLTGSALIALALAHGRLSAAEAWAAAHVDEDWNMLQWGSDPEALARRAAREAELRAAAQVLHLLSA